jgi:serine/threonine protein kinase
MSARTLTNVVNDQTIALNALIYGYAGHSLVTPHVALQLIWWTEERINEKVTQDFVTSRLQPHEREKLTQSVGFGDLSDDTYIEWILEKARRLFLVLAEIGEADRIFAVVDKSWNDDDLPLQMDDIEQLALSNRRDQNANARFYHTQFTFLLRELRDGVHIDYAPNEECPLEYVMGLPPAVSLQSWPRVHLPKRPKEVYVRRRFALGNAESPDVFESDFMMDVESAQMVEHEHIAPIWASYTAKETGYIVTSFVGQHTLRSFIDHRNPTQYQKLPKDDRRWLLLNWLHCLADAVATLHRNGFCHSAIRPTNILIDERNAIAFSDIGSLETFQKDKRPDPMDVYVYGAPEAHVNGPLTADQLPPLDSPVASAKHSSVISKSSSGSSNNSASPRHKLTKSPTGEFSGFNFGFKKTKPVPKARSRTHETEKADVFSLGCVFLEVISFMLKKKPHDFIKHRSSKHKISMGGKNSRTDSSYHANLDKLDTWIELLEKASFGHDDNAFRAIPPILILIRSMLSRAPAVRPTSRDVRDRLLGILLNETSIPEIHCGSHKDDTGLATFSDSSSSARSSSVTSLRTMSTMSSSSDADTIRLSTYSNATASSLVLNSYCDRSTLSGNSDDDNDSIRTIEGTTPPYVDTSYESPRQAPIIPSPPTSPRPTILPADQFPSPPRAHPSAQKVKPWSKPFLLLP